MKSLSSATATNLNKIGKGMESGLDAVADVATSPFKPGVPVVEAREDAFKEVVPGRDQALAYQKKQQQKRSFWSFSGPVDFQEPTLPDEGSLASGGLLPPKL